MIDIPVVDAHHHLWDLRNSFPWLQEPRGDFAVHGDDQSLRRDYLAPDFLADAGSVRVEASIVVEAAPADALADARWLQHLSETGPIPSGIVAAARLELDDAAAALAELASVSHVRGVRQILNWHPDPRFTYTNRDGLIDDHRWRTRFATLNSLGLSFDLQIYPWQMDDAARLAHDNASTLIVLNHAGMPIDRSAEGLALWRSGLARLASLSNVFVKISGIGMTDHHWNIDSLRPIVLETIEAFGAERSMFASNFPVDGLYSTYEELYEAYDEITTTFSHAERVALFGGNARRIYDLPNDSPGL